MHPNKQTLEDDYTDVVAKAGRGTGRKVDLGDNPDDDALAAAAETLGLHAGSLIALARGRYRPEVELPDGLLGFATPHGPMVVNAYLVADRGAGVAAAFDTGTDADLLLDTCRGSGLDLVAIFLTHTHPDHVAALPDLARAAPGAVIYAPEREPWPGSTAAAVHGRRYPLGDLTLEARSTWGHSPGGTTYVVTGLARPVAIVGDALFAGSMGGANISYQDALDTNRRNIFTLPDDCVICPGHGPCTTVGMEKAHNPFFPELHPTLT